MTYTLQQDAGRAVLTVVTLEETVIGHHRQQDLPQVSLVRYLGTATEKAGVLSIAVANGADKVELECKRTKIPAARADAGRTYHGGARGCGDDGRWKPSTTKPLAAFLCTSDKEVSDQLALSPAPGIEWVFVSDDCLVGGGWREVPKDGSIANPRSDKR
ncbi:MAG: hypothetical protein NT062_30765 [Proteobacteria bacterium]|nr:hypothetical protein [Pseudomonadota bacterium]